MNPEGPQQPSEDKPSIAYRPQGQQGQRGRRPKATKAQSTKRPVKLSLETEVYERLVVHGLRRGMNLSELVSDLAIKNLNDWIVHAKPGPRSEAS
jgi:hypothetical protein